MLVSRLRVVGSSLGVSHLASLVLGDLVLGVLLAVLALAVGPARLRDVDLWAQDYQSACSRCEFVDRCVCEECVCGGIVHREVATAAQLQRPSARPSILRGKHPEHATFITNRRIVRRHLQCAICKHIFPLSRIVIWPPSFFLHHSSTSSGTVLAADTLDRTHFGSRQALTILTVFRSSKGGEVVVGSLGVVVAQSLRRTDFGTLELRV